jgi:pyruvate carboxylase
LFLKAMKARVSSYLYVILGFAVIAGKREVFFEANGIPRVVEVIDRAAEQALGKKAARERADLVVLGSVGAPMAGTIIEVQVKTGEKSECKFV